MSKKTVDQHDVVNRWREIADELAAALRHMAPLASDVNEGIRVRTAQAALRRYEEARDA